ncbi:MAG: hypothetical protein V4646_11345 [Pseudomonadota bacterium]
MFASTFKNDSLTRPLFRGGLQLYLTRNPSASRIINMLRILAVLTLGLHIHVRADTWEQPNEGGGRIVLTDRACNEKDSAELMSAYTYLGNGSMLPGCWATLDAKVHIVWDNGKRSVFSMYSFVANPANKQSIKKPVAPL